MIRRVHELALIAGIAMVLPVVLGLMLTLSETPWVYVTVNALLFAVSNCSGLLLASQSPSVPPIRGLVSLCLSAVGLWYFSLVFLNDAAGIMNSEPQRFLVFTLIMSAFFLVPWVSAEFRIHHRSPPAFDAILPPFIALLLFQVTASRLQFYLFWSYGFWLILGLPTILITYFCNTPCDSIRRQDISFSLCVYGNSLRYLEASQPELLTD
ncbi:MAG: hypothetical protein M3Y82_11890 [Verrucomicrobiota bacterium]|nr:hypothetical protein [Verrucomicrobiota bacterium]